MSTPFKRIVVLSFLFLGSLPWLFILLFYIHRGVIQHEMEEKLEKNIPLHTVVIPDKDIIWEKTGKEIRVNGKMFDIKSSIQSNGYTTFTGLYDEEETALEEQLREHWRKNANNETQVWSRLLTAFQNLFIEQTTDQLPPGSSDIPVNETPDEELEWLYMHIPTPPPRA